MYISGIGYNRKTYDYNLNFKNNHFSKLTRIVKKGALEDVKAIRNLNALGENGETLLHVAAAFANLEVISYLSEYININQKDLNGNTPISMCIEKDRLDVLEFLHSRGANLNIQDNTGRTPIMKSLNNDVIFNFLLSQNVNLELKNIFGDRLIHLAWNDKEKIKKLKQKNVDLNSLDGNMENLIHYSINANNIELLNFYLEKGINPDSPDHYNETPIFKTKNLSILEILKKHKVNFNHQNNNGDSCLHKAIKNNNIEIIDFLLETGLNVNLKNKLGETAGFYIETEDLLDKLIKVGLNINATNNKHESLLHIYAKTNNKKLYTKLIDLGADENIKDINNETPSDIAKRLGYHNLISYNSDTFGFSKVIGMQKLKEELYEMVIEPLKNKEEYQKYGLAPANGILLHGLPGCGKTFIAKALAEECGRNFYEIKSSDISSPYYGGATQTIKQVFEKARNNPPSIIFIDEMEGVAPNRETLGSGSIAQDNSERVNELLQQMNNLSKDNIFVIGATNNPEKIDSAIKRPGRIDRRVFVAPPDIEAREGLFKMQLKKRPREVLINYNLLASKTEYYTAEEIKIIVDNAAKKAKKIKAKINMSHLLEAINKVKPSLSKSEIEKYKKKLQTSDSEAIKYQEKINTSKKGFNRVVGMKDLKNTLINDVIVPMQVEEERFKKYGIEPINGMILYGPPGTGKTFIAEAFAEETERFFIKIEPSNIVSKWYGESTSNIKKAFEQAEYNSPAVIFIDEIESLAPSRNSISIGESIETTRTVNELLQQLNNLAQREIFVIAATNNPDEIDEAIKRVGRFDKMIFVPPPDAEARREFFKKNLENKYIESNIDYEKLANLTEYFTIAEIQQLVIRESAQKASKMNSKISEEMLIESIKNTKPKLNKNKVEYYKAKADN